MAKDKGYVVVDEREKPFFVVDIRLVTEYADKLSVEARLLFIFLLYWNENKEGTPSFPQMAEWLGVPNSKVLAFMAELKREKLVILEEEEDTLFWSIGIPDAEEVQS